MHFKFFKYIKLKKLNKFFGTHQQFPVQFYDVYKKLLILHNIAGNNISGLCGTQLLF